SENPQERAIRSAMVDDGAVEAIIALPPQLFRHTAIPVTLWVLAFPAGKTRGPVLFVDATRSGAMVERNRRVLAEADIDRIRRAFDEWRERRHWTTYGGVAGFSASVSVEAIRENGDILNPLVY